MKNDEAIREALALLPSNVAAELVAEARRHALSGTSPAVPKRTPGDSVRIPPDWLVGWRYDDLPVEGRHFVPLAVVRWWIVMILLDAALFADESTIPPEPRLGVDRLRSFCKGYLAVLRASVTASTPGVRLGWALSALYGGADAASFRSALSTLPAAVADAIADEALRILEAESVPCVPGEVEGVVASVARWRCELIDAMLRADLEAVRDCAAAFHDVLVVAGARALDPLGWQPLVAVPFMEAEA